MISCDACYDKCGGGTHLVRKGSLVLVESIRTPYVVILLLHHIALRTMQYLSVGEGLVVAMLDSLGLCHFHISVIFFKKNNFFSFKPNVEKLLKTMGQD